jgi:hypothetical protein
MDDDDLPRSVWSGEFKLGSVTMKCHTLDNGQRVIEQESVLEFFAAIEAGAVIDHDAMEAFGRWQRGQH